MSLTALYGDTVLVSTNIATKRGVLTEDEVRKLSINRGLVCPDCNEILRYKHGNVREAHFSHDSFSNCPSVAETPIHRTVKGYLYDLLIRTGQFDWGQPEYTSPSGRRFDLYFEKRNQIVQVPDVKKYGNSIWESGTFKAGIEVQHSQQLSSEFHERLKKGTQDGIFTMLILIPGRYFRANSSDSSHKFSELENVASFLHGTVYYCNGKELFSFHSEELRPASESYLYPVILHDNSYSKSLSPLLEVKPYHEFFPRGDWSIDLYRIARFSDIDLWWNFLDIFPTSED